MTSNKVLSYNAIIVIPTAIIAFLVEYLNFSGSNFEDLLLWAYICLFVHFFTFVYEPQGPK